MVGLPGKLMVVNEALNKTNLGYKSYQFKRHRRAKYNRTGGATTTLQA